MAEHIPVHIDPKNLTTALRRNFNVLKAQLADVTHEESLIQPPYFGNCYNWVLGHVLQARSKMLNLLDEPHSWTPDQSARYDTDSEPIKADGADVIRFEQMVADLETTQNRLMSRIDALTTDDLNRLAKKLHPNFPDWSLGEALQFLLWHETYHAGQTEILRQLAGKNDKVI